MLKKIKLTNVGSIPDATIAFGKRLNIITGDNGLGKSFLLDILWYVLTRRWPAEVNSRLTSGYMARPANPKNPAQITFELHGEGRLPKKEYAVKFDREKQAWVGEAGRPYSPGLVIYAHADGSFSVWDSARNYWSKEGNVDIQERQSAFVFSPAEVWNGLKSQDGKTLCNGLIQDWAMWQIIPYSEEFSTFKNLLKFLSPPEFLLEPGDLTRIGVDDVRDIPTIKMPYGEVPVMFASAGIRRILALSYFMAWAVMEHIKASSVLGISATKQIVFLMDEVEAHLHPKWQRTIMSGFMNSFNFDNEIQIVAVTHSALVMSSVENLFDCKQDKWFDFDETKNGKVEFTEREYQKYGDVDTWLKSKAFDLTSSFSSEAEEAMKQAKELLSKEVIPPEEGKKVYQKLLSTLSPTDAYLSRFRYLCEKKGIQIQ